MPLTPFNKYKHLSLRLPFWTHARGLPGINQCSPWETRRATNPHGWNAVNIQTYVEDRSVGVGEESGVILNSTLFYLPTLKSSLNLPYFNSRTSSDSTPLSTTQRFKTLIHSFSTSRLDYCNALLYGSPASSVNKLKYIQNSASPTPSPGKTSHPHSSTSTGFQMSDQLQRPSPHLHIPAWLCYLLFHWHDTHLHSHPLP